MKPLQLARSKLQYIIVRKDIVDKNPGIDEVQLGECIENKMRELRGTNFYKAKRAGVTNPT